MEEVRRTARFVKAVGESVSRLVWGDGGFMFSYGVFLYFYVCLYVILDVTMWFGRRVVAVSIFTMRSLLIILERWVNDT